MVGGDPFWFRGAAGAAEFGFTDARTDLGGAPLGQPVGLTEDARAVARELGGQPAMMRQVHAAAVAMADPAEAPEADALIVDRPGVVAFVRVADCVPAVIVDLDRPLAAVVHAGRVGMAVGVVPATVAALRARGGERFRAWIGPRACGRCYEVPDALADEVAGIEPLARSTTSWGTAALDIGAGVTDQLRRDGVEIVDVGGCTIEDERFWSHRRQGDRAGRFGAALVLHEVAS